MSFIRLAINLGMSAAPAIGGFVAVSLGYKWLFWFDGLTCIGAAIYFWVVSRKWSKTKPRIKEQRIQESDEILVPPYKNRNFMILLISTFLIGFCFVQWFHTVPVFIKSEWGFDERYIGMFAWIKLHVCCGH